MIYFIPIYMAICAAWAGGSLWPSQYLKDTKFTFIPELLFSLPVFYALFPFIGWWALLCASWSYIWFNTGHANALPWGDGGHNPQRVNTLSPLVKLISRKLSIEYYTIGYARLFMSVKGFLITLPVGGLGLVGFPLGYEIGQKLGKNVYRELLSGFFIGVNVLLFIKLSELL